MIFLGHFSNKITNNKQDHREEHRKRISQKSIVKFTMLFFYEF